MSTIDKKEESGNKRRTCCSQERIEECRLAANSIMNTKINPQHTTNSYNGDTIGRDSPSALLEVLAEVASQTLHSEKKRINSLLTLQCKSAKVASVKRKESCFTVSQLLSMPVSHLVKQFTIFTSDELKKQYSYTCALVPDCQKKYTSFASEEKARVSIKNHLEEHLEYLKADKETYDTFIAKSVNHKSLKTNLQSKKNRVQQTKKPQETLNKENKDVIVEKSTNYFRKILLNDINIKENEKQKCFQKLENKETHNSEMKKSEQMDTKVLGDHSYFERLEDDIPDKKEMSSFNNVLDNTTGEEHIVLMVVGTDSVHTKEYSHVNQKLAENTNHQDSDLCSSDETRIRNMEISNTTKPKGKAKFIGTSKEEREMALAYIERIKKKGNPTGSNLQCRICDPPRSFTAPTTLVSHYRSHAGIKPYECRICRAVFTRRHSLKYHMLIHQNQTRFTCTDCGKKFRHPSHFREHQRRHTGEAPFGCDDCGQRFKTRNTYKRHLKTRHGKILTTVGEVFHLSEEDFQKVRTNRRKKDCIPEAIMNVDDVASNVIVDFGNHYDKAQAVTDPAEEYVLKEDIDDIDSNWETKDCRYPDSNIEMECINDGQNGLLELKNSFYSNLKVTNNEEEEIAYQHNIEDQNKTFDCSNEISCEYSELHCNNEIVKVAEDEDVTTHEVNIDFSEEQNRSSSHVMQKPTHDYHYQGVYDNDMQEKFDPYVLKHLKTEEVETTSSEENNQKHDEKYNTHLIITEDNAVNEKFNKYANSFDIENKECAGNNIAFCAQIANTNVNIQQTIDEAEEEVTPQNNTPQENKCVCKYVATDSTRIVNVSTKETNMKVDEQNNRYLYIHTEPLNKITQSKCRNMPYKIKLCRDQQNQLQAKEDSCKKIKVLNGNLRAINIKQSEKQNAILLVSDDNLKDGIFQIDKSNISVEGLKR
ncbi:uncharacterized protein [Linepithema humile]|uniref:uncharacterized protein isoform X2 n=1 Tax=Linepithema humile TaxID=83485 RepID=UPI00351E0273